MVSLEVSRRLVERKYTILDALAIDDSWAQFKREGHGPTAAVTLDFSKATYLEHDCLLYLGALASFRRQKGYETRFELPHEERLVEYLRSWNFPSFIRDAAGMPFEECFSERTLDLYVNDQSDLPKYVQVISSPGGGVEELLPRKHFAITPIPLSSNPFKAAALAQESWLERHLVTVLDRYLGGEGKRIATHVILEAVLNAASHPRASMAYTSSQFLRAQREDALDTPRLEIAIWDNGDAFGVTLQRALRRLGTVRSPAYGTVEEQFNVRLVSSRGRPSQLVIDSQSQDMSADFSLLTVAAFLIGVTSIPDRSNLEKNGSHVLAELDADMLPDAARDHGGLGLYLIRRTVIDLFGGTVRYMSGNYRLNISRGAEPARYEVLVQYRPRYSWPLRGNLLILDIPIS